MHKLKFLHTGTSEVLNFLQMNYRWQDCDLLNVQSLITAKKIALIRRVSVLGSLVLYLILQVGLAIETSCVDVISFDDIGLLISKFDDILSHL